MAQALEKRTELAALRKAESLRQEEILHAKAAAKPSLQLFAGYGSRSSSFSEDLTRELSGWFTGAQASWDLFDGFQTKGKVDQARALHRKAQFDLDDNVRRIELEVRTAYSYFIEARELLESQKKSRNKPKKPCVWPPRGRGRHRHATRRAERPNGAHRSAHDANPGVARLRRGPRPPGTGHRPKHHAGAKPVNGSRPRSPRTRHANWGHISTFNNSSGWPAPTRGTWVLRHLHDLGSHQIVEC